MKSDRTTNRRQAGMEERVRELTRTVAERDRAIEQLQTRQTELQATVSKLSNRLYFTEADRDSLKRRVEQLQLEASLL